MRVLNQWLAAVLLGVMALPAHAGTFYYDEALFNAALGERALLWSEDFEGFTGSPAPTGGAEALAIGEGEGVILTNGTGSILSYGSHAQDLSSINVWLATGTDIAMELLGFNGVSPDVLGATAVSAHAAIDSDVVLSAFLADGEVDTTPTIPRVADLFNTVFVGWIGDGGEELVNIGTEGFGGIFVDNIHVYGTSVPVPAGLLLLLGLLPLALRKRV